MPQPMTFANFARTSAQYWDNYLETVWQAVQRDDIETTAPDPIPSFPQSILATELPHHYVMELVGGRRQHRSLRVLKHAVSSTELYFGQFGHDPSIPAMIDFGDSHHARLSTLAFVSPTTEEELQRRFPGMSSLHASRLQWCGEGDVLPVRLGAGANFISIDDCLFVNSFRGAVRIRNVQLAIVVRRDVSQDDYLAFLRETYPLNGQLAGFRMIPGSSVEVVQTAAQFANLYLVTGLREVSIGRFIEQHSDILTLALGHQRLISEPFVPWQVESPDPAETAINPDIFLVHENGRADVYELKLPLLDRKRTTKGPRRRRRFIDSVEEGVAQLAQYRDFFSVPENRACAEEKYGVRLDAPVYGLIVGNYENVDRDEIMEASRRLEEFVFLDYDTLLQLYLGATGVNPIGQDVTVDSN